MVELGVNFVPDFEDLKRQAKQEKVTVEADVNTSESTSGKSKGKKGGKAGGGLGALLTGGIGGILAGLLASLETVQVLLEFIGSLVNTLVVPNLILLVTLLRPVMALLSKALPFMIGFFRDPVGTLKELFEFIGEKIRELPGMIKGLIGGSLGNAGGNRILPRLLGEDTGVSTGSQNVDQALNTAFGNTPFGLQARAGIGLGQTVINVLGLTDIGTAKKISEEQKRMSSLNMSVRP